MVDKKLEIRFHGRVIEHLGIDMYQSPVAAIAELVSNAWDAEATKVDIGLPASLGSHAEVVIADDGDGMTFAECQERFLNVGYNRRRVDGKSKTRTGRPVMGRKGIGKFAGFGIARMVEISTISISTGEKTTFVLDVQKLLGTSDSSDYVDETPMDVEIVEYSGPNDAERANHGTTVRLKGLTFKKTPNANEFGKSMARRFLLLQRAEGFLVTVNHNALPDPEDVEKIEFDYPGQYAEGQAPAGLELDGKWGIEKLPSGETIRWRFLFHKEPISQEDLAGISVFSHGKLAQRPFYFQLGGGLGGQQGLVYLSGSVEADFIDDKPKDLISTERQRVNWDDDSTLPLLEWGQARTKQLLRRWQDARAQKKVEAIEGRMAAFSGRLEALDRHEKTIVKRALTSIAKITTLSDTQFADLAHAILTAWEGGKLRDLIADLANSESMDAEELVKLLADNRVMTALHAAEGVKTTLNLIIGLEERIRTRELENAVRDYIAENPWLISPTWDTFQVERGVNHLIVDAAGEAGLNSNDDWNARVDLVLSSGDQLLIVEFMRPGLTIDWDHLNRFQRYVFVLREKIQANASRFRRVTGLLVADKLERRTGTAGQLRSLRSDDMDAMDWEILLQTARAQWIDYFKILIDRAPDDARMLALAQLDRSLTEVDDSPAENEGGQTPTPVAGPLQ
ncbi:ATP-binding protein [Dactylosporangium sp. NPDC049140]|uniref:ATP-binding protein n=1 Tax=Dactylosporangium sp. NPDC049140 TaxID=3155647 RepID=UPI0033DE2262